MIIQLLILLSLFSPKIEVDYQSYIDKYVLLKPKIQSQEKIAFRNYKSINYVIQEDWKKDIQKYICTKKWDCKTAVAVAIAESGLNPDAVSYTNDYGIFQLNNKPITDWKENIDEAYKMYERRGWQPWVAYNTGRHKQYLNWKTGSGSLIQ
jgi:hypothetical protein